MMLTGYREANTCLAIFASTVEDFTNYVLKRIQTSRNKFSVNPGVITINYCVP